MIGRTPNTFIVGTGRMAVAIAGGLRLAGVPVLGLWGRQADKARAAGAASGVAAFSSAPPDLLLEANVVIVAVSDNAISDVAKMLVGTGLLSRSHALLHCSGALSAHDAFADVADRVGGMATLHPLRAVPDGLAAMRQWSGCVFGIEGNEAGRRAATDLVAALGGEPLALEGDAMAAYHTAAATASNYLVTLLDAATTILTLAGIDESKARSALVPLMQGTLESAKEKGGQALTGPIRRGDVDTIARHIEVLAAAPRRVAEAYRSMGQLTVALAREIGEADDGALDAIESLLTGISTANETVQSA